MTFQDHLSQANHNERLFQQLGSGSLGAYDWAITVMFYSLLHFVDAWLLQHHNIIPKGHTKKRGVLGRNDYVKQHLPQIYGAYKRLYDASIRARYEGAYLTPGSLGDYQNLKTNQFDRAREFFRQQQGW